MQAMKASERDSIKEDLGVIRALLHTHLEDNTGIPWDNIGAANDAINDLLDRLDGWVAPSEIIAHPSRHTTARLRAARNKIEGALAKATLNPNGGYTITDIDFIRLGGAGDILRDIIREREERKRGNNLGS